MQKNRLYSFGFNAFQQTGEKSELTITKVPQCHAHVKKVLFCSWETTILLNDAGDVIVWGFKPHWLNKVTGMCKRKQIQSMFGDPNALLGMIDEKGSVSFVTSDSEELEVCKASKVVYCQGLNAIITLLDGTVTQYNIDKKEFVKHTSINNVNSICASNTHVLFGTKLYNAPVYGYGSNRLSQLGMDYQTQEETVPTEIEYFCGLGEATDVACGPFHSAVILGGEVYTFGWSKDGRLGRGTAVIDDIVDAAVFLGANDQPIEINASKVVCGSSHMLVLDDQGIVWSCGSNKYNQLGRDLTDDSDPYFRRCTLFDQNTEKAIDIFAGRWNSFVVTHIF